MGYWDSRERKRGEKERRGRRTWRWDRGQRRENWDRRITGFDYKLTIVLLVIVKNVFY